MAAEDPPAYARRVEALLNFHLKSRRLALAGMVAVALFSCPLRADEASDKVAGTALFDEGRKLMASGNFDEACKKFAAADKLIGGVGVALNLGDCLEKNGKPASAWKAFQKAKALARERGDAPREALARTRADAIEPRVPHLRVVVGPDVASIKGLVVTENGETLPESSWETDVPVDPGSYLIEASSGGQTIFSHSLDVSATDLRMTMTIAAVAVPVPPTPPTTPETPLPTATATVTPPPASTEVAPSRPPTAVPSVAPAPAAPAYEPHNAEPLVVHHPSPAQKIFGYVFGGAALAAGGVAAGFGALALINTNKTKDPSECGTNDHCNAAGFKLRETAIGQGWIWTGFAIGAASGLTLGIILVATAPKDDGRPRGLPSTTSRVELRVGPMGAAVRGSF